MSITSPCIDVCRFDARTGWCKGCGRTIPEIRDWRKMGNAGRKSVTRDLNRRLERLRSKSVLDQKSESASAKA